MKRIISLIYLTCLCSLVFPQSAMIDSLKQIIASPQTSDSLRLSSQIQLAVIYQSSNPPKSLEQLEQALPLAEKLQYERHLFAVYFELGAVHFYMGEYQRSRQYFDQTRPFTRDNQARRAAVLFNIGLLELSQSRFDSGRIYCEEAQQTFQDTANRIKVFMAMGGIFAQKGDYAEGLKAYFDGLNMALHAQDSILIVVLSGNIAETYLRMEHYPKAIYYLENYSFPYLNPESPKAQIMRVGFLGSLGKAYLRNQQYDQAEELLLQELQLAQDLQLAKYIASAKASISDLRFWQGDMNEAIKLQKESLHMNRKIGLQQGMVQSYQSLTELYFHQGDKLQATTYLDSSFVLAKQLHIKEELEKAYFYYAKLDSTAGNFRSAFDHYQKYVLYRDSTLSVKQAFAMADVEMKLAIQEKEEENELLKKNDQLQEAKLTLQNKLLLAASIGSGILLILLAVLAVQFREKRRSNRLLEMANEKIRQINRDLEDRVRERTIELEHKNQQLMEYASMNSHKVRGPLARILGLVQILQYPAESSQSKRSYVQMLDRSATELDEVVKEMNQHLKN